MSYLLPKTAPEPWIEIKCVSGAVLYSLWNKDKPIKHLASLTFEPRPMFQRKHFELTEAEYDESASERVLSFLESLETVDDPIERGSKESE